MWVELDVCLVVVLGSNEGFVEWGDESFSAGYASASVLALADKRFVGFEFHGSRSEGLMDGFAKLIGFGVGQFHGAVDAIEDPA